MPDYKKKRRNKVFSPQNKVKKSRLQTEEKQDIKMSESKKKPIYNHNTKNMKVVSGKKLENRRKIKATVFFTLIAVVIITVLQLIIPAGLFETVANKLTVIGTGSYPIDLDSGETVDVVSAGAYYYVLSDTNLYTYSNGGKELINFSHGFENPVLKVSDTRALLLEQGGTKAYILSNKNVKETIETEKSIITGCISDSGRFAITTRSSQYTSEVLVYSKKGEVVYEWYSAEETINNVALNPKGTKLAVSTFSSNVGEFNSKFRILNYDSANAEYSEDFNGTLIYDLNTNHNNSVCVVTTNKIKFIKWSNYKLQNHENDYNTALFFAGKGGYTAVLNRESDKTDNRILIFSKSGELKSQFNFKGIITDVKIYNGQIYCLSDTEIYIFSKEGEILRKASCGFGAVKLAVTGTNTVAVITDNTIEKIKLVKE